MKKELPISQMPYIRAYPQYAFLDAIINNKNTNSDKICVLDINNFKQFDWKYHLLAADKVIEHESINIYRRGYGIEPVGGFYCNTRKLDEIVFNIQYMQYTNIWDRIAFFYEPNESLLFSDDFPCYYEFSIFCCGDWRIDLCGEMAYYKVNRGEGNIPKWYKVQFHNDMINVYYSFDNRLWCMLESVKVSGRNKVGKIGFYIHLYENQYQKWLCNNFIQIRYDNGGYKLADYSGFMNREWKNYAIHPFIKFSYDKKKNILKRGLWNHIVENICSDRYLEIWLNEYHIEGMEAFQSYSFNHESLIYGFDEVEKSISMMSFRRGKPTHMKVPIGIVEQAWEDACGNNNQIITFEFVPDDDGYYMDIEHIYSQIVDYLSGRNSSKDFEYIAEKEKGVFGQKIYSAIQENINNMNGFLDDTRVAYFIKEHKECMLLRIEILYGYGAIRENVYPYLEKIMKNIVKSATLILNLVIKNNIHATKEIQDSIWKHLNAVSELEEICYSMLLKELKIYMQYNDILFS